MDPHASKTKTLASVLFQLINCSAVIIDPIVYIMYHKKYRKAIGAIIWSTLNKFSGSELTNTIGSTPESFSSRMMNTVPFGNPRVKKPHKNITSTRGNFLSIWCWRKINLFFDVIWGLLYLNHICFDIQWNKIFKKIK